METKEWNPSSRALFVGRGAVVVTWYSVATALHEYRSNTTRMVNNFYSSYYIIILSLISSWVMSSQRKREGESETAKRCQHFWWILRYYYSSASLDVHYYYPRSSTISWYCMWPFEWLTKSWCVPLENCTWLLLCFPTNNTSLCMSMLITGFLFFYS